MTIGEIDRIFGRVYKGKPNFMTPTILEYFAINNDKLLVELSSGKGIFSDKIYGVTVLEKTEEGYSASELTIGGFYSLEEAKNYITSLSKE